MLHKLIKGGNHSDNRGTIRFNNDFDASDVKRMYTIENESTEYVRGWQGHAIERRWFSVLQGKFEIKLIKIDNWEKPSKSLKAHSFLLTSDSFDVLCVPKGYISSIQALEKDSKLLAMADHLLGEVKDEYRFESDYFTI